MRKITLLFALALGLVLCAPWLVGRVAQARHEALIAALAANIEGGRLASSVYEDGWFTSRALHHVVFDAPVYRELERGVAGAADGTAPPGVILDSRLAHGPWPGGGGGPALMTVRSALSLTASDGASIDIPGAVRTRIGLTGHGESRFVSPGVTQALRLGRGLVTWDGADITVVFERGARALRSTGTVGRLVLTNAAGELVLGQISISGQSRRSGFGFWTGRSAMRLEQLEVVAPDGSVVSGQNLNFAGEIGEADGLVDFRLQLDAEDLTGGAVTDADLAAVVSGNRIDAAEWGRYLAIRRGDDAGAGIDFTRLTRAGPILDLERLRLTSPDGELVAAATLAVPADSQARGPLTALGAAQGEAALTVSPGLLARLAQSGEQLRSAAEILLALGYLREHDGNYAGELKLHRGLLTVNGKPVVLPL